MWQLTLKPTETWDGWTVTRMTAVPGCTSDVSCKGRWHRGPLQNLRRMCVALQLGVLSVWSQS
jgi:hypothetical protein